MCVYYQRIVLYCFNNKKVEIFIKYKNTHITDSSVVVVTKLCFIGGCNFIAIPSIPSDIIEKE